MNSSGCKVEFDNKKAKIYDIDGKLIRSRDQTRGYLYYLDMNAVTCVVVQFYDVWLWNKRLC